MLQLQELLDYGISDFTVNLAIYIAMALSTFVIFWVLFKDKLQNRRIQQKRNASSMRVRDEVKNSIVGLLILTVVDILVYLAQLNGYTKIYTDVSEYGWVYLGFSVVAMIFLHDTWFYFTHRFMHHPKVYKHVHKVHHQSTDPSPFAAFSFHPLEAVIEAGVYVVFAFTFPVHLIALWSWQMVHVISNIISHLGYEVYPKGLTRHWLFKYKAPSTHHNMHHAKAHGNYGFYFTWWDKIFKTEFKDYDKVYESIHERVHESEAAKEYARSSSLHVAFDSQGEDYNLTRKAS